MKKVRSTSLPTSMDSLESRMLLSSSLLHVSTLGHQDVRDRMATLYTRGGLTHLPVVDGKVSGTLTAPSNLSATAVTSTSVNVTWAPGSGAAGYYLYRSVGNGSFTKIATLSSTATAYTDSKVAPSTSYAYYAVAYKQRTLSANSNTATVSTPAPAPETLPTAAGNLAISGTWTNSIALSWNDLASNESGYRVYRSTDGVNYSVVASLAANTQSFTDSALPAGTQFYYNVAAWNSAGESATTPVTGATNTSTSTTDPISIFTRYGGELVLAGTSGNDSIFVSQSGTVLTIVANGTTTTQQAPANGLFIYSFGGSDNITVDASVSLRTTIATIDGASSTVTNGAVNASIWGDSNDSISGPGSVHKVSSFFQNVSKSTGINIADPTDAGATFRANASLWGAGPQMNDVNQGGIGDCYFLASLSAFANATPAKLQNMAVDLGDGTYAVQYLRGGVSTVVRVDGDISSGPYWGYAFSHPGATGDIWAMIMEKSYAYFRSAANSYSSLSNGWMNAVYSDFGVSNTSVSLGVTASSFYNTISTGVASGKAITFGTTSSPPNLVGNHAYTLVRVTMDLAGNALYVVRNPWGFAGTSIEDGLGYSVLTFAQMQANFTQGVIAT